VSSSPAGRPDGSPPEPGAGRVRLTRADLGSWLSGPSAVIDPDGARQGTRPDGSPWRYRGERLGLPESGRGSLASTGRRLLALAVDWAACLLLVRLFLPHLDYGTPGSGWATLGFFAVEVWLFTSLAGASFGQRLLGMQVVRFGGSAPGPLLALVRTLLLVLVVPALVWDRDGRGLHDRLPGLVLLRT
jgi:hypothetical protein